MWVARSGVTDRVARSAATSGAGRSGDGEHESEDDISRVAVNLLGFVFFMEISFSTRTGLNDKPEEAKYELSCHAEAVVLLFLSHSEPLGHF